MKRRIVSLLLAVIMLFGLLPVTALAETLTSKGFGSDGKYYYHYNLNGLSYDGISINYTIWGDLAANYDIKWELYTRNIYGGSVQNTGKTDKSLHEHNLKNVVGHSFNSSKYWFYLEKWDGKQKWKLDSEVRWAVDTKDADSVVTIGSTCLDNTWAECGIRVYLTPLNVPMEDSTKPYLVSVTQKSKAAIEDEPRDVELYVEGKYVGKQVGAVRFPNREDAKASDLNIKVQDGFDIAKIEASGSTYKIYLVYGPRKVTIRYKLIGEHNTNGLVETNGLKNSTIANAVFQDKSWNQSNIFTKEYNQLPTTTVEINTARSMNQLPLYESADVKLVSGNAGIEKSGTDKYKITVGYENSVIEVAYKAKFPHDDPLYIDWYKRGAGGIFDLLQKNANQPYGFDLTNLHEQETFYVIQNGGLTQEAKDAGPGQEYVDSEGQHYRFWKAAVGFDWDWIDSLYYKSSAQTWFYTYKIDLYYRDIFAHEWKVWKTITVGPIEVPYDEGRINFVYQRYNPDTGEDNPEDTGDYSFTLAYDGNAGAEKIGVPQPTVMSNVALSDTGTYEIPVSRYQPERTDYKFLGWDENPNATTLAYPAGNLGPVIFNGSDGKTQTKTLYAIWEKTGGDSATYTATYYWNYTENTNSYHTQENLKTGNKLTQPDDPTREGYTFGGWYTTDTCTDGTKWDFEKDTVQKQDIYLYAKWTKAASTSYTINYYKDYQDGNAPFDTISGNGYVGDVINADVDNNKPDATYIVDTSRTTKTSMKLVEDSSKNVLNVYYEKDEHGNRNDGTDGPDGVPDKYQKKITFIVVNGTWSDNTTTKDVYVTLLDAAGKWSEDGTGTLTAPTDMKANATYDQASGKWNTTPPATVSGTADVTYKYSFSKSKVNYTVNYFKDGTQFDTVSDSADIGTSVTADVTTKKPEGYVLDTAASTTSKELDADSTKNILNVYYEKDEKGGGEDGDDPDNIPDKYQKKVTFQIVNGTWADGTDADKIVYVTLYKDNKWDANGEGTLTAPTGMTANATYDQASGKWDTTPPATVSGTADVTYKYSFSKSKVNYTVNYFKDGTQFDTVSDSADIGTSVTADVTTKKPEGYVLDTAASTTSKELDADSTKNILNVYYEKDEKGGGEDGDDPDNIPDKYQKKVTYKVVNGTWSDGKTADKYEYVTLLDENGKWSENGTGTLTAPTGMTPDTGFIGGSWAPTLPEKVTKDSADTYTYSFSNDTRKVTVTNVGSGHTDKDGTNTVNYGDSLTITISPDANYCIDKITLDNVEQEIPTDKKFVVSNVTTDKTVEITYAADDNHDNIPDKYQKKITYKVVNGFWDTAKTDKADKVEYVTLLDENSKWSENGTGTLTAPTGMTPDTGFIGGSWDALVPTTVNKNTTPDTYTYTFIKDDGLWATVTYEILNGHGSIDAGQTASFTVLKGTKWGEAGITAPTTTAESGYRFAGWVGELAAEETIETSFTITGSFVINEGEWVTIQFAAGPNGSLIGDTSVTVLKNTLWSEITVPETKGDTGYTFLEWSPELPDSTDAITESATYTAYFTKKDGDWVSVDYVIVGGHGDFVSGAQTHFEILKDTLWGEAGISAPAVEAEYGYYFDGWTGELAADEAISENITVVGRFEQEFDIIPAIIEILKPRDMLTKEHIAYLNGYSDGTVRPNGNITRAEVATIFFRLLTDEVRDANLTYGNTFTDVPNGAWYNAAVSTLSSMQIINGYTDGSFRPNQNITRAELASIIARFAELKNTSGVYFTDIGGHWAADNICLAAANGWITGYADGSFKPNRPVTRAETVTMINRVLERSPLSTDDLLDGMVTYSDNLDTTAWYYLAIQEASNTHDYTRMTVGEFWRSLLPNRDWSRYQR